MAISGIQCETLGIKVKLMDTIEKKLVVESSAFDYNGLIPLQYTCEGENINPSVEIGNAPEETKTFVLIMEDPDAPDGVFTHWLLWNIISDKVTTKTNQGVSGMNDFGKTGYGGPCPPSGTHHYYLKVYALDKELSLAAGESKNALLENMEGHILATGELMGRYSKKFVESSL